MTDGNDGGILHDILQQLSHLNLTGRTTIESSMIAAGGFCDVFKGNLIASVEQDRMNIVRTRAPLVVAIKRLRVHLEENPIYATVGIPKLTLSSLLIRENLLSALRERSKSGPGLITLTF